MFKRSIEAVIAEGTRNLETLAKLAADKAVEARAEVSRCQSEIQTLVNLGKQVPEKVFDRYSQVLVSTIDVQSMDEVLHAQIQIGGAYGGLRGLMGENPRRGKYRVIVLLEPIA